MQKLIILGLSGNPPGNHHLRIAQKLLESGRLIIIPRGTSSNKLSTATTTHDQRLEMVKIVYSSLKDTEIDSSDLIHRIFTPTWMIDQKYKDRFPNLEIWHAIGGDIVKDGANGNSEIQREWQKGSEIWSQLNWAVIDHPVCPIDPEDLPPNNLLLGMKESLKGRSKIIRERIANGQTIRDLVSPKIEKYITDNHLYK